MKKLFGIVTLALVGILGFSACGEKEVTKEEGKAWVKENGYVKKSDIETAHYGEYKLKYLLANIEGEGKPAMYTKNSQLDQEDPIKENYWYVTFLEENRTIELGEKLIMTVNYNLPVEYDYMFINGDIYCKKVDQVNYSTIHNMQYLDNKIFVNVSSDFTFVLERD